MRRVAQVSSVPKISGNQSWAAIEPRYTCGLDDGLQRMVPAGGDVAAQDRERVSPRRGCEVSEHNFCDCTRTSEAFVRGEVQCLPGEEGNSGIKW